MGVIYKAKKRLQLRDHLVSLLHPRHCVVDELVYYSLGRLLLVDNGGTLAHEEWPELVKRVVAIIIALSGIVVAAGGTIGLVHDLVEVGLVGDCALGGELLHLGLAVDLPVVDVGVVAHAQRSAGEDERPDVVIVARGADGLLVGLGGSGLIGQDETGADPNGAGAHHERSSEKLAVVDAAGGDDLDGPAGKRRLGLVADLDTGGDEDRRGDIASMATALTTLGADDVDAEVDALLHMLDVADHVHVDDAGAVELVDDGLGGHADGGDEELGARVNDDVDHLVELALGVVVASRPG